MCNGQGVNKRCNYGMTRLQIFVFIEEFFDPWKIDKISARALYVKYIIFYKFTVEKILWAVNIIKSVFRNDDILWLFNFLYHR